MDDTNRIYRAGCCYHSGIGVEKNEYKTFIYYKKSVEVGDASTCWTKINRDR